MFYIPILEAESSLNSSAGLLLQFFLNGTAKGSIYALLALGYTMVYGIIQLINFAHGEIYMISAFVALAFSVLFMQLGIPGHWILLLVFVLTIFYGASYGVTLERMAYKPLRKSPRLSLLISAIAMSMFLQNFVLLGQSEKSLPFPQIIPDLAWLNPVKTYMNTVQFTIYIITFVILVGLSILIKFTKIGKAMRASSQDQDMAQLLGIDINKIISLTFILGSVTAAVGGILISSYSSQVNYYIGFLAGIKAFVAAVLGGIGSIPGAVLGSFILGWIESFVAGYIGSEYENVFAFLILILILVIKPAGILGKKESNKV